MVAGFLIEALGSDEHGILLFMYYVCVVAATFFRIMGYIYRFHPHVNRAHGNQDESEPQ
jgi:hypothetical protein